MLQLLQPIWMYTATAAIIPLAIHLWNIRKGKQLKIGSLLLITETLQQSARQLRITEWLLLLLRCLLILLLALLLSQPMWKKQNTGAEKGWILVPKELLSKTRSAFKPKIDSLLKLGWEFHYFNFPFENGSTEAGDNQADKSSYWQRLAQLDARLPDKFPVHVFSDGNMQHFRGNKPYAGMHVQWSLLPADSLKSQPAKTTTVQKDTLRITIFQEKYPQDAQYVRAALEAIRPLPGKPIQITSVTNAANIPRQQNFVWWLSDQPVPVHAENYIGYAGGKAEEINSEVVTTNTITTASVTRIPLYKRTKTTDTANTVLWSDGFGDPLLTASSSGQYHLYTHFDPSWNGLVWDGSFPELLFNLLNRDEKIPQEDNRQIDPSQLQFISATANVKTSSSAVTDLSMLCWILLLVCFVAERWISLTSKTKVNA